MNKIRTKYQYDGTKVFLHLTNDRYVIVLFI